MKRAVLLWLTPLFWLSSIPLASYGIYASVALLVLAVVVVSVVGRFRDDAAIMLEPMMFAAIWWPLLPAAVTACVVAVTCLLRPHWPRLLATIALVALAAGNPPVGPVHMASISALVIVHAILVGVWVIRVRPKGESRA